MRAGASSPSTSGRTACPIPATRRGTVADPAAVQAVHDRLAVFEPERLRAQVTASWEREATVQTAEEAKQLLHDQYPFHVADPEGPSCSG